MSSPMKWYLAGPMTGFVKSNYPAFTSACKQLRSVGFNIVSPHEVFPNEDGAIAWEECLRHDVSTVTFCHGLILLPGWSASKGARLELLIATTLGYPIRMFKDGVLWDIG